MSNKKISGTQAFEAMANQQLNQMEERKQREDRKKAYSTVTKPTKEERKLARAAQRRRWKMIDEFVAEYDKEAMLKRIDSLVLENKIIVPDMDDEHQHDEFLIDFVYNFKLSRGGRAYKGGNINFLLWRNDRYTYRKRLYTVIYN